MESINEIITPTVHGVDGGANALLSRHVKMELSRLAGTEWQRNADGHLELDCTGKHLLLADVLPVFSGWRRRPHLYAERMRLDAEFDALYQCEEFDPVLRLWWELARKWWGLSIMPSEEQLRGALLALRKYTPPPWKALADDDDTILPESTLVERLAYIARMGRPADRPGLFISPISARLTGIIWAAVVWQSLAPARIENGRG